MAATLTRPVFDGTETGLGVEASDPLTVLVLDDSAAQRNMACALLRRWGHRAVACADPGEALEIARGPDINLILCDWMMPGMTGPEFCRALRDEATDNYKYILLLTSKTDTGAIAEGLEAGADDFLSKPMRLPELRARINAGARIVAMQRALRDNNRLLETALDELQGLYGAIDRDLDEARRLQHSLLQDRFNPQGAADISLFLQASGHVGGDMVGYFQVDEGVIGLFSLDVSGHGVASAMIAARIAGMMSAASPDQNIAMERDAVGQFVALPPDLAAGRLNDLMLKEMQTDRYFTLCLGFLDLASGKLNLVQAGHPHPIVRRADGTSELVGEGGMPVGLLPDVPFTAFEIQLNPGDRLLMYSDGYTECPGPAEEMLEEEGLIDLLDGSVTHTGPALLDHLHSELIRFSGTSDFPDDLSALLVEYHGPDAAAK